MKLFRHGTDERILKSCLDCPFCIRVDNWDGTQCYKCIILKGFPIIHYSSIWKYKNFNGFLPDCPLEDI